MSKEFTEIVDVCGAIIGKVYSILFKVYSHESGEIALKSCQFKTKSERIGVKNHITTSSKDRYLAHWKSLLHMQLKIFPLSSNFIINPDFLRRKNYSTILPTDKIPSGMITKFP